LKAALIGGVVAATFSWPQVIGCYWLVPALWYASLVLLLTSMATAAQQAIALSRLICHPRGGEHIRELLGKPSRNSQSIYEPRRLQLYIWQIPISMLNTSVYACLLGILVFLCQRLLPINESTIGNDGKVTATGILASKNSSVLIDSIDTCHLCGRFCVRYWELCFIHCLHL
jgi:hypothetical protein